MTSLNKSSFLLPSLPQQDAFCVDFSRGIALKQRLAVLASARAHTFLRFTV